MFARFLAALLTLAALVGAVAVAWPQLFGLEQAYLVAQAASMRGLGIAASVIGIALLVLLAVLIRPARGFFRSLIAVLVVFALVNTAVLVTRGFGVGQDGPGADSPDDITVLAWNTLGDEPGAEAIADLATEVGADVISLPETTEETGIEIALRLREAGNPMWVHTIAYDQVAKARSTTLLIAPRLGAYTFDAAARTTGVLPTVVATPVEGDGPTIVAVHAVAPITGQMDNWRDDLVWLAELCTGDVVLAGDFNATIDHMTSLAGDGTDLGGCRDAAAATGHAALGTWPTWLPAPLGAPIDHIMATDTWRTTSMRVITELDNAGSDHRPVVATLSRTSADMENGQHG
ncbi:endonuclease/exonuclease/phosphatase family protein [Ruicaihuangia caeni]|uniref:endonuclease/exonuclease/phosphatase family protein n=1 Tax=Ruicaihuangia caeni TaxID=3042517 RepID=UPI00338EB314